MNAYRDGRPARGIPALHSRDDVKINETPAEDWLVDRPNGTLEDAIAARDPDLLAQWARYFRFSQGISMRSLNGVCRVIEEIGYIFTGERYDELESVWNVSARIARERGHGDRVTEIEAAYKADAPAGSA